MTRCTLVLVGLIATPVLLSAQDKDIRCQESDRYIGNLISPVYALTISGPKEKKWEYTYTDDHSGTLKEPITIKASGSYEFEGDLVIFTGHLKANDQEGKRDGEVRFGLNYGFPDKKVMFNRFFPTADGTLRYHAKWFRKIDGQWQPLEERILTLPAKAPEGNRWAVRLQGQRICWDKGGKKTVNQVDEELVFKKGNYEWFVDQPPADWVPATLYLQIADGRVTVGVYGTAMIGEVRGFNLRH